MPLVLEVGSPHPPVFTIGNSLQRGTLPSFSTPFSREIIEAPRSNKVKMPFIEPFNGTIDPDDHLDVNS